MSKAHFDDAAGAARGEQVSGGLNLRGEETEAPTIAKTGVFLDDKELSHEDLAKIAITNPRLHRELQKMRGTLQGQSMAAAGASKNQIVSSGAELPEPSSGAPAPRASSGGGQSKPPAPPKEYGGLAEPLQPRRGGERVLEHLPGRKLHAHISGLVTHLKSITAGLHASSDPVLQGLAQGADSHLDHIGDETPYSAEDHLSDAEMHFGNRNQVEARRSLLKAGKSVVEAHKILSTPYIAQKAPSLGISYELPSLDDLALASKTSNLPRGSNPFFKANIAGKVRDVNSPEGRNFRANAKLEPGTAAAEKVRFIEQGTPRQYKYNKTDEEKAAAAKATKDAKEAAKKNPDIEVVRDTDSSRVSRVMRKASKERTDTSVRTAANKNVPSIMGKAEIGPDIGSQDQPELSKPTRGIAAPVRTPQEKEALAKQRASRAGQRPGERSPKNIRRRRAQERMIFRSNEDTAEADTPAINVPKPGNVPLRNQRQSKRGN